MATEEESLSLELSLEGIDDVEDFVWGIMQGNQGESLSMSLGLFNHLHDLMDMGNAAFREHRFEEAVNCYSRAHNIKPDHPVILSNRSAAHQRLPSIAEHRPLNGLDPTVHASLAVKDAEQLMKLCSHLVKPYILKANALILLKKLELARDATLSGLQVDFSRLHFTQNFKKFRKVDCQYTWEKNHGPPHRTDDFDCTLCLKLLYGPTTTPCGHTFCRLCLFQSMDRGNRCPSCRTVLFISLRTCAISVTLNNIIERNFPEEHAERKLEHDSLTDMGPDLLPLFVMDVVLPCQKFHLNIFEARYRLMVRRIMVGNRRMGMVILDYKTGCVADHACEVEITDCEPLSDGRLFLEVESRRRCQILKNWNQDGYRVAEVEWGAGFSTRRNK